MKDINEFHEEPVFDEMFSLLHNFISPYVASEEEAHKHIKRSMEKVRRSANGTTVSPQTLLALKNSSTTKFLGCPHKMNKTKRRQNYVQVWFLMHLPKNKTDNHYVEHLLEHFFEELVRDFEALTSTNTQKILLDENTTNTFIATDETDESSENTASESDSTTVRITQKPPEETEQNANTVRFWEVFDKHKRSVESATKDELLAASSLQRSDVIPFLKQQNNPLRSKRIKREILSVSAPQTPTNSTDELEKTTQVKITAINATDKVQESTDTVNEVIGVYEDPFLHIKRDREKPIVQEAPLKEIHEDYGSGAQKNELCFAAFLFAIICCRLL